MNAAQLDPFERAEFDAARAALNEFDAITDRVAQSRAWVSLNETLGEHASRLIAHDPVGYVARAPLRAFVLWATDLPIPSDSARSLPALARAAISSAELVLVILGVVGAVVLALRRSDASLLPLAVIVYVSALGLPFGTEARYALAAKPLLIIAAVAGFDALRRPSPGTRAASSS
jgi:hypothetical protein